MIWFLSWLLAIEIIGLGALPLAVRLFRWLPDRGFLFAKPLGVLVVGYLCWILGVFGLLRYQQATIIVVLLAVAVGSWVRWGRDSIKQLAGARTALIAAEVVFLVGLVAAAAVRAFNPDISGTEKPMDFAILNALYRTDVLPPEDPWMSGHSISYYYFGYYLLATVAKISAVPAEVGYNLSLALVFALLLAGSFSLAFNVIATVRPHWSPIRGLLGALVAPVVIALMGNLEIGLEVLAARGYSNDAFWKLVAVKGLEPATQVQGWFPTTFWWWWRASRIIPTTKPDGINEFPYFSFLLGDLHPHFIALPWVILAVAVALAAILARSARSQPSGADWTIRIVVAIVLGFPLVGNSWDFPAYTALFWLASIVPLAPDDWGRARVLHGVKELALISIMSVLLYAPFFLGFASQTRGVGLSGDRTPVVSMLIIFGPVLLALVAFLAWRAWPAAGDKRSGPRLLLAAGALLILGATLLGSAALIAGVLSLALAAFWKLRNGEDRAGIEAIEAAGVTFLLVVSAVGLGLILVPEFVFLVDLFGTRMNTVFKFHYEAWVLLGLAASVGIVWLATAMRPVVLRAVVVVLFALPVSIGLLYPLGATLSKTQDFTIQPTLDGAAFYQSVRPDDYAAIQWLSRSAQGRPVVLEATGGEYSDYGRVSTFSGLPSVLGWAGHEVQWRGRGEEPQQRTQDIDAIYATANRDTVQALLDKYRVQYVFVGSLEFEKYGPSVADRFTGLLDPAYRQGSVAVYRVVQRNTTGA